MRRRSCPTERGHKAAAAAAAVTEAHNNRTVYALNPCTWLYESVYNMNILTRGRWPYDARCIYGREMYSYRIPCPHRGIRMYRVLHRGVVYINTYTNGYLPETKDITS